MTRPWRVELAVLRRLLRRASRSRRDRLLNGKRLGLPRKRQWTLSAIGIGGFVVAILVVAVARSTSAGHRGGSCSQLAGVGRRSSCTVSVQKDADRRLRAQPERRARHTTRCGTRGSLRSCCVASSRSLVLASCDPERPRGPEPATLAPSLLGHRPARRVLERSKRTESFEAIRRGGSLRGEALVRTRPLPARAPRPRSRGLELEPDDPGLLDVLALNLIELGDLAGARSAALLTALDALAREPGPALPLRARVRPRRPGGEGGAAHRPCIAAGPGVGRRLADARPGRVDQRRPSATEGVHG